MVTNDDNGNTQDPDRQEGSFDQYDAFPLSLPGAKRFLYYVRQIGCSPHLSRRTLPLSMKARFLMYTNSRPLGGMMVVMCGVHLAQIAPNHTHTIRNTVPET